MMNPLFDNYCRHRTILSIHQPDYRKDIRVLFGTPGSHGKDLLGFKGHSNLIEIGSGGIGNVGEGSVEEEKSNVVKKDLSRQEEILHRWGEINDIANIVHHPHEYQKNDEPEKTLEIVETDTFSDDNEEEISQWIGCNQFHHIHRTPINSHVWAVLVIEDNHDDEIHLADSHHSTYTVSHKRLIPADEI